MPLAILRLQDVISNIVPVVTLCCFLIFSLHCGSAPSISPNELNISIVNAENHSANARTLVQKIDVTIMAYINNTICEFEIC